MRRSLAYLLAWALATAVTAGVAWLGIRSVLAAATPNRAAPLSAADLRRIAPTQPPASPVQTPRPSPQSPSRGPSSAPPSAVRSAAPTGSEAWATVDGGYRRTFRTAGGDVVAFCKDGKVEVRSATPRSGYSVTQTRYDAGSVLVTFTGKAKTSKVLVRWLNGPYAEVTETAA